MSLKNTIIEYMPWIMLHMAALATIIYAYDTFREPLEELIEITKERKKIRKKKK